MRDDLRDARRRAKLSQAQLAERIGRDQGAVSRYESGEYAITPDVALLLAKELKLDVVAVLYGPAKARKHRKRVA